MGRALVGQPINRVKRTRANKRDILFYFGLLLIPLAQFAVFYIAVNANSILLCFQEYKDGAFQFLPFDRLFENFSELFQIQTIYNVNIGQYFFYSFICWITGLLVGTVGAIFFSYYIYKRRTLCNFFKFFLFLPSIIPGILLSAIFIRFINFPTEAFINEILGIKVTDLLNPNSPYAFTIVLVYCIWIGFGSQVLFYTNAMNQISPSLIEASEIDGCKSMSQLFRIVIPCIMPTIGTFLISGISGFFINQAMLLNFFPNSGIQFQTIGYFIYTMSIPGNYDWYPLISSLGICCSLIAIPAVLILKKFLKRFEN